MGDDPNVRYDPSKTIEDLGDFDQVAEMPYPLLKNIDDININQEVGGLPQSVCNCVVATGCWEALANDREHGHLSSVLMKQIND